MSCSYCNGTGRIEKPNNPEEFDQIFDKYDAMGQFCMDDIYKKALKESGGYTMVPCPFCNPQNETSE